MNIAYLILAHKNPKQLKRLINTLDGDIFIHIDKKKPMEDYIIYKKNVIYIDQRIDVRWGGYGMIEATLNLINVAYNTKKYNFFILLSGDDYPIKKLSEFNKYLSENQKMNFIEFEKFDDKWKHQKVRYNLYRINNRKDIISRCMQGITNTIINKRKMYKNYEAYKGSQWWCLSFDAIKYIIDFLEKEPKYKVYFKHTLIPDEMFFQIILLNSNLSKNIKNNNLRYIKLENRVHPDIFNTNHLNEIKQVEDRFFARKFDINIDSNILDILDEYIT